MRHSRSTSLYRFYPSMGTFSSPVRGHRLSLVEVEGDFSLYSNKSRWMPVNICNQLSLPPQDMNNFWSRQGVTRGVRFYACLRYFYHSFVYQAIILYLCGNRSYRIRLTQVTNHFPSKFYHFSIQFEPQAQANRICISLYYPQIGNIPWSQNPSERCASPSQARHYN